MPSVVHRDVPSQLLNLRTSHRKPGHIVYPFDYSRDMCSFDNWDFMFLESCTRGLTMAQFDKPPATVLDLGCGGGYWAIEAAKRWTSSYIVGFDIAEIQPDLKRIPAYKNIASRIEWEHGNLLEGIPYADESFDLIRVSGLGLAIPEDEWQYVLEDIRRLLKPGGALEIIEDDLLFPCPRPPRARLLPLQVDFPPSNGMPSSASAYSSILSAATPNPKSEFWSSDSSLGPLDPSPHSANSSEDQVGYHHHSIYLSRNSLSEPEHLAYTEDPQDHSKLKHCWEAMLSSRFVAPQPLSVLPFYLSSIFSEVQAHAPIQIPLPVSNRPHNPRQSVVHLHSGVPEVPIDVRLYSGTSEDGPSNGTTTVRSRKTSRADNSTVPIKPSYSWAKMHLAKKVQIITKCKEAMWVEYEQLFGDDPSVPPVTRTSRASHAQRFAERPSPRPDFERAWSNWENDMMDRIGMRSITTAQCSWLEPHTAVPDWRIWRRAVDSRHKDDSGQQPKTLPEVPQVCRSFRGFVCWKR